MTDEIIARIIKDIRSAAGFDPHSADPPRSLADGYAVQDAVAQELGPLAGWKIAVNAPAVMAMLKLDEPASGRVFAHQRHDSPAALRVTDYRQFALEPEIAAVRKPDLVSRQAG